MGDENEERLEVFDKYGPYAQFTDLFVLTGGALTSHYPNWSDLTEFTADCWTKSAIRKSPVVLRNGRYNWTSAYPGERCYGIRPVLKSSSIFSQISPKRVKGDNNVEEVKYGEYPQDAVDKDTQEELEEQYKRGMSKTGRSYTFNSDYFSLVNAFKPVIYEEYEYMGKKYIRVQSCMTDFSKMVLSNGVKY